MQHTYSSREQLISAYENSILQNDRDVIPLLKQAVLPEKIYKFFSMNEHWKNNILNGMVFLASPLQFNDPYDCYLRGFANSFWHSIINGDKIPTEEHEIVYIMSHNGEKKKALDVLQHQLEGFKSLYHIACFSERFDSFPMWAHYAANHSGYVIEYDVLKMQDDIKNRIFKVIYSEQDLNSTVPSPLLSVLQKQPDWSYENEWRIISTDKGKSFADLSTCVSAIYLGSRFDESKYVLEYADIMHHCSANNITLKKVTISPEKMDFGFEVIECQN